MQVNAARYGLREIMTEIPKPRGDYTEALRARCKQSTAPPQPPKSPSPQLGALSKSRKRWRKEEAVIDAWQREQAKEAALKS